jgi:hypothetical protein
MRSRTFMSAFARVTISILLVTLLLVQDSISVQASNAAQASSNTTFALSISQAGLEICVGETVNVTIQWGPNKSYDPGGGLEPLTPLAGPSRISLKASLGTFVPDNDLTPGSISGTSTVNYTAEQEGTEKLFAVAWIGGSSDAIATDTFKVKACEYMFTLDAEFDISVTSEVGSYTARYTVKSYGTLVPTDPNEPRHLEAKEKLVKMTGSFTSFSVPKCTLFTWDPATGQGRVDARADPGSLGVGMFLQLAPPRELAWDMYLSFCCDGDCATFAGAYPVSSSDPWIAATFPSGTGTKRVVLDMFEIPYNKIKGGEGIIASYVATLTLEKKDSQ